MWAISQNFLLANQRKAGDTVWREEVQGQKSGDTHSNPNRTDLTVALTFYEPPQ